MPLWYGGDRFTLSSALHLFFAINVFCFQQINEAKTKLTEDVTADKARRNND
jgi:hypothetical protein